MNCLRRTILVLIVSIWASAAQGQTLPADPAQVHGADMFVHLPQVPHWSQSVEKADDLPLIGAHREGQSIRMGIMELAPIPYLLPKVGGKGLDYSIAGPQGEFRSFAITDERTVFDREVFGSIATFSATDRTGGAIGIIGAKEARQGKEMASQLLFGKSSLAGSNFRLDAAAGLVSGTTTERGSLQDKAWRLNGESDLGQTKWGAFYEHKGPEYTFLSLPTGEKDISRIGMSIGKGPVSLRLTEGRSMRESLSLPGGRIERYLEGRYRFDYLKNLPGTIRCRIGQRRESGASIWVNDVGGTLQYAGTTLGGKLKGNYALLRDMTMQRDLSSESSIQVVPEQAISGWVFNQTLGYRQKSDLVTNSRSTDLSIEATVKRERQPAGVLLEGGIGYTGTRGTDISLVDVVAAKMSVKRLKWKNILGYDHAGISLAAENTIKRQPPVHDPGERAYSILFSIDLS
ncbi:hypothetical protein [Geotalea sp. SG265]|uniref:hypothetical protein n=1 Tax=Geotalea sp. SG265 TaxID=2922867 RepID=UPI001FAEE121|nr:hypothetical protein [Geotalea sp. SG265]